VSVLRFTSTNVGIPPHSTGRPPAASHVIACRMQAEHARGKSFGQIARDLDAAGERTAQGGRRWWPATVRSILLRRGAGPH